MQFFAYLAVMVIGSILAYALAPKPPKQRAPALEDFDVPTAESGRPIPWVFGTRKIKDPNCIWYGDLEVRTKTKDRVKTRLYRMGLHLEICIGPIDKIAQIHYGDKVAWTGDVQASEQITISQPNLYGGRDKEGGIDGDFDLCFGEPTQAVNDYLSAQLGTPLSAFRDSFCIVGRKPSLVANSTYIKPIQPTVRCILSGWPDDAPWYPETAIIPTPSGDGESALYAAIMAHSPAIYARFEEPLLGRANLSTGDNTLANDGSGPDGDYLAGGWPDDGLVPDGTQAVRIVHTNGINATSIQFPDDAAYNYDEHTRITLVLKLKTDADYRSTGNHYLYHQGDHNIYGIEGLGVYLSVGSDPTPDKVNVIYKTAGDFATFYGASVDLPYALENDTAYFLCVQLSREGGVYGTGFVDVHVGCNATHAGSADFPNQSVAGLSSTVAVRIGAAGQSTLDVLPLHATIDNFVLLTKGLTTEEITALAAAYCGSDGEDMNPAHIIYKCWVDQHQGMAEDPASIDDAGMRAAALTFYQEGLGLSLYWRNQTSIREFVGEVLRHAGAIQSINPDTGQLTVIPLRGDYDADALDLITEDQVLEVVEWDDAADGEATNQVSVKYERHDGTTDAITWSNRAAVAQFGVIAETREYPGITNAITAGRIAKRDVKQASSNLARGKLRVNRTAWDKYPGAVFRFSHGPEGIDELIVRVMEIDAGTLTNGSITVTVVQDVFSLPLTIGDVGGQEGEWTPPTTDPSAASTQALIEAPYWTLVGDLGAANAAALDAGAGYLVSLAVKSSAVAEGYNRWTRISPNDYAETGEDVDFAPNATLTAALDRSTDSAIALSGGTDLDLVEAGWIAMIGTGASAELCYVFAVDTTTNEATLLRGRLDTTPQEHAAGTRVWFLDGDAPDWPRDPTQWADADTVDVKLQPITGGGVLALASATAMSATLDSRQVRPYPPGNIAVNGEAHPITLAGSLTVTWSHRDRIVQGYAHVSQYDATDYGPEAGTTYNGYIYDDATDALITSASGITGTSWSPTLTSSGVVRLELEAVRDGYVSWQRQVRTFTFIADRARIVVSGDPRETATGTIRDTTG